jgi:hypothetical protein
MKQNNGKLNLIFWIILPMLSLAGLVVILLSTRWGAGLLDDSYWYIKPVRDFLSGQGLSLNPSFPPLVDYVLVGMGFLGMEPLNGIRLLNALLFGANIFLTGLILRKIRVSVAFSLFGALLVLLSDILIEAHSWALSEPLYFFLSLLGIYFLIQYFQKSELRWLVLSAIIVSLDVLTRYAGFTLIAACVVTILLKLRTSFWDRVKKVSLFLLIAITPIISYSWRHLLAISQASTSQASNLVYLIDKNRITQALYNVLIWFVPGRFVKGREFFAIAGIAFAISVLAILYRAKYKIQSRSFFTDLIVSPQFILILLWISANWIILIIGQVIYFGKGDAYNSRYLSPMLLVTLILLVSVLAMLWQLGGKFPKAFVATMGVLLVFVYAYRAQDIVRYLYTNGIGYSSARWHESETISYLNAHPDVPVMSTGDVGVYFWTGRLPLRLSSDLPTVRKFLIDSRGYLVIIDSMPPEMYGMNSDTLTEGLHLVARFGEGSIYQYLR